MNVLYWTIFALILWGSGYCLTWLSIRDGLASKETFILSPEWLYKLCGKPKGKDFPERALSIKGVYFQICSFSIVIYTIIFLLLKPAKSFDINGFPIGWTCSLVFALVVSIFLVKKHTLSQQEQKEH